jgi:hypothetical protein
MATQKLRGYSLVMKPDRSSSGKTLKIYGVYEDVGGKACIQRVKEVDENFKNKIRDILAAGKGVAEKKVVVPGDDEYIENQYNNFENTGQGAYVDSDQNKNTNIYNQVESDFDDPISNKSKNEKFILEYSEELKGKMETFFVENIERLYKLFTDNQQQSTENHQQSNIYKNNINKIINNINDNDTLNNNINELLINVAKFAINKKKDIVIEKNKLYSEGLNLIKEFLCLIYDINSDVFDDFLSNKFNELNDTFENKKIKSTNFDGNYYNTNNFDYKIFAQHGSDYLLIEKSKDNIQYSIIDIVFIHSPEETNAATTTATTPDKKDETTELAIAAAAISANTTNKGGGKTQKRLPKRKRSIVFSRRK